MDSPSPLASNGLPFLIDLVRLRRQGAKPGADVPSSWRPAIRSAHRHHRRRCEEEPVALGHRCDGLPRAVKPGIAIGLKVLGILVHAAAALRSGLDRDPRAADRRPVRGMALRADRGRRRLRRPRRADRGGPVPVLRVVALGAPGSRVRPGLRIVDGDLRNPGLLRARRSHHHARSTSPTNGWTASRRRSQPTRCCTPCGTGCRRPTRMP